MNARQTALNAFNRVKPHIKGIKKQILKDLLLGSQITPDDFADKHNLLINTVRRRFTDLWIEGKIRPTGNTKINSNGNNCTLWELGKDEDRKPSYKERAENAEQFIKEQGLWNVYNSN